MKAIKYFLIFTILLVVVVVGGISAFVGLVDPNDFKEQIATKVFDETGRQLTLDGDIEWAFWPKIKLKAGPLALSNAPGFGDEPFFAAEEIQVAVATLPLLKQQIEMDTVKLYGVKVNLAANADGVTNWADLAGGSEEQKSSGDIATIALGGVDIQNANITWRDAAADKNVDITDLNVSTGALTFGDPIAFEISLGAKANKPALDSDLKLIGTVSYDLGAETYHVEPMDLDVVLRGKSLPSGSATITSRATVDIDLDNGLAKIGDLTITGLGAELKGDIEATDIESATPGARGKISLSGRDLALLFKAFEFPVAKQIGGLNDRSFKFDTEFDADMQSGEVTVPQLTGKMLGANLSATLQAQRANTDKPAAKGSINANGPDLPSLLAVVGQLQGLDPKTLSDLVKVLGSAKDKSFTLQSSFDSDMQSGQINVPTLEANLLGNTISGHVASQPSSGKKAVLAGSFNANGPDLPSLLAIAATFQGADSGLHEMSKSLASSQDKTFNVKTNFESDGNSGVINLPQLAATGLGLVVDGRMKGQNMDSDKGTLDGRLTIKGNKLTPLLTALGKKDLAQSVHGLDVDAGINGAMTNLAFSPLKVVLKVAGPEKAKPVDVTLTAGSANANLDKETLDISKLSLTGLGMNITGNVNATKIKSEPAFNGTLDVPNFNLRSVMQSLNQKLPPMSDPKTLSSFGMKTDFAGTSNSIALNKLTMKLDQSTLAGNLTIANFEAPAINFDLNIDNINADRYLAPKAKDGATPVTPEAAAAGAAQLPVETLRGLNINGKLIVQKMQISGAKMDNAKLNINAKGGSIKLDPVSATLYKGSYNGAIELNATKTVPSLSLNSVVKDVDIESMLFDMTGDRSISGTATIDAKLTSVGNNGDKLKSNLSGPLKFNISNGVYRGIDVAAMLAQVEVMVESKTPGSISKGGETKFQSLSGIVNFTNGIGKNDDLLLDGSGFKITGDGTVADLRTNTMKYDAKVSVDSGSAQRGESTYNLGGYTIPIRCRGELGADACKPDIGDIVAEIGKSAVKKEIGKQLEKAIGGDAGETLKKLFKF
ncbi:MAG: AsmA family protein [Proteobacteria bacterium]|nr:AsmA family protein [Pseudomonadota bacterium]